MFYIQNCLELKFTESHGQSIRVGLFMQRFIESMSFELLEFKSSKILTRTKMWLRSFITSEIHLDKIRDVYLIGEDLWILLVFISIRKVLCELRHVDLWTYLRWHLDGSYSLVARVPAQSQFVSLSCARHPWWWSTSTMTTFARPIPLIYESGLYVSTFCLQIILHNLLCVNDAL